MANRFLSNIKINDAYTFPASDGISGQVIITDGSGNLSFSNLSSLDGAKSNFVYYDVKNSSGSTINKGTGVMAVGTDGNSGHILIAPMIADGSVEPKFFMGVLETTLLNGEIGKVVHFGQISQINTSTFTDGDVLWCDPANPGGFTITEPLGPNVKIAAAIVINASINGKIKVRVQGNPGLHELHDVRISSQSDGQLLIWDNTLGVWKNESLATIADSRYVNVSGDTMTGNLTLQYEYPRINLIDTNHNSDYSIINNNGAFSIYDITNNVHRLSISNAGDISVSNNLTVTGDLNVIGAIDLSNADLNIGAADIIFDTASGGATRGLIWSVSPGGFLSKLIGGGADGGKVTLFTNMDDAITTGNIFEIKDGSLGSLFLGLSHAGILTVGGGTSTQWNTAYNYSQVGHLPLAGGNMSGNINWGATNQGLTWTMNTDGAYIKFYNTGDGDTDSRLEYGTSDNGNEYHRFMISGTERMKITATGITATGYNKSNWDTAYSWGNHAGLYLPLGGGALTGQLTVNSGSYNPLKLDRTATNNVNMSFYHQGVLKGYLGIGSTGDLSWGLNADSAQNNTIIHAGNIADQSVNYANNAGSVDGIDSAALLRSDVDDIATGTITFENGIKIGTGTFGTSANRASIVFGEGSPTSDSMYIEYDGENLTGAANSLFIGRFDTASDIARFTFGGDVILTSNNWSATSDGTITATSFVKSGGTSSDFLKADGSIDSNAYLTTTGKAADSNLLDGLDSTQFLRSDVADTAAGIITILSASDPKLILQTSSGDTSDWNYINFVGRDAVRDAYVGTNSDGDLYLYSEKNSYGIFLNSGGVQATASIAASSFIDNDNTAYYLNPASTSNLNSIVARGTITITGEGSSGATDFGYYQAAGTNLILQGDSQGRSGIFFQSEKNGTNINHPSDYGFIQFHSYGFNGITGESNVLAIGVANDSTDTVVLQSPYNGGVKVGYRDTTSGQGLTLATVFHDNYHPNADTLTSARTFTIGSTGKSFNGSGDLAWTLAEIGALGATEKAADSNLLDGIDSTRIIYGDNSTGTSYIAAATLDTALKSGFYTTNGGVPNATGVNFVLHNAYYTAGNLAGFDLACNDSTTSSFYLRPATGAGKGAWQTIITSANINSQSQFLRSDSDDTTSGSLTITGSAIVGTNGTIRLNQYDNGLSGAGEVLLTAIGGTGWNTGDTLGRIRFYTNDASGTGARDLAKIEGISEDGNGTTTTTPSGALVFYTSLYDSNVVENMRLNSAGNLFVTGYVRAGIGDNKGFEIGAGGVHLTAVTAGQAVFQGANEIRFGPSNWDYNQWGGIKYTGGPTPILYIGGPASSQFSSNPSPPSTEINFTGTTYVFSSSSFRAPIFYDSDNTAYYVNPAGQSVLSALSADGIVVNGSVSHQGLSMSAGSGIDQITEITKSLQLVADTWIDTGISGTDIGTSGVYILYMGVNDYPVGGGHYSEVYSSTISWMAGSTNSAVSDEIYLHRAGHAPNSGLIQLRTVRQSSSVMKLQIKGNISYTAASNIVFKFRRMI